MNRPRPTYLRYRRDLTSRARILRRDPTLRTYIADFYCAEKQLVIELDGDSHFTAEGERYDRVRTAVLGLRSIRVLRFTNAEVMDQFEAVCARIDEALRAFGEK